MRPQRLEMEGFLAYRSRTAVDFTDTDLFVLSGPTGAGKSSVIDAMTFALYGTIPRLSRGSVAPVINVLADRARVLFEFSVGDESYTAARLVERRGSGASTTEARLMRGEEVLAGNADQVSVEVADLLGLRYEHFVKAVVLPQGEFAAFLTDKPGERQALLRALLDLGLYEKVMQLANQRARAADARVETIADALDKLDVPTDEEMELARDRLNTLVEAEEKLPSRVGQVERLDKEAAAAIAAADTLRTNVTALEEIVLPPDLETLEGDLNVARERLALCREAMGEVSVKRISLDEDIGGFPERRILEGWDQARGRLERLVNDREALSLEPLLADYEAASAARDHARAAIELVRVEHAAHELRRGLQAGEPCPVCMTVITALPPTSQGPAGEGPLPEDLALLDAEATAARDRLKEAEGRAKQIEEAIVGMESELDDAPSREDVEAALAALDGLMEDRSTLEEAEKQARIEADEALAAVAELGRRSSSTKETLLAARDRVAGESPPLPGDDPVESWRVFDSWRQGVLTRRRSDLDEAVARVDEAKEAAASAATELMGWLTALGVELKGQPATDLALAVQRQQTEVKEMERAVADATDLGAALQVEKERSRVSSALGSHLKSNNFEAWLLSEALGVLVDGANLLLDDLSAGAYSLEVGDNQFQVVDHRNAQLVRTTKSLSGGETFLVSLALALSMADQLALLTGSSSRLESVFLDEGFGSLDQESLDVVAAVLDELAGRGRTVGIVTHVKDLADRMPVRFEVSKGPETASIRRVGE